MAVSGITRVMKWIFVIFNILVLIAGAIAIGLGAWGLASEYGAEKLKEVTGSEFYRAVAIAIIVGGSVMVLLSFTGVLGAVLESKWVLGLYFVIMLLLLILFVTAATVGFAYRDKIEEELSTQMEHSLLYQYMVDIDNNDENYEVSNVWDSLQKSLDCCGVKGGLTSNKSWFLWQSSQWFKDQNPVTANYVPSSCCVGEKENSLCQKINPNATQPIQLTLLTVREPNPSLYHEGCVDKLNSFIYDHIIAIGGIAIAILIIMFLSILLSVCICANIKRTKFSEK